MFIKVCVALMAELVDAQVSGTCGRFGRGSSSLLQGTNFLMPYKSLSSESFFYAISSASTRRRILTPPSLDFCKLGYALLLPLFTYVFSNFAESIALILRKKIFVFPVKTVQKRTV